MNSLSTKTEYRNGVVLVAVMWIVILLTLIVAVVAQSGMIDTRISHVAADSVRCKWAARAGLEMAIAVLNDDEPNASGLDGLRSAQVCEAIGRSAKDGIMTAFRPNRAAVAAVTRD